jgi:protein SCO1/2
MGDTEQVKRFALVLCSGATTVLSLVGVVSCSSGSSSGTPKAAAAAFHGIEPDPAPARPDWVLTDTTGARYDFRAQTHGRPTYLYFGYTHCPDECPTAMADIVTGLRKASKEMAAKAVVVFVTTDPERDTPAVLRRWLNTYSTSFVGLTGTDAELAKAQLASGVATAATPGPPIPTISGHPDEHPTEPNAPITHKHIGPLGYSVSHSAVIFAFDAADRLPVLYPAGVTPSDIADDLPLLLDPSR